MKRKEFFGKMPDGKKVIVVCSAMGIPLPDGTTLYKGIPPRIEIKGGSVLNFRENMFYTVDENILVEVDAQIHIFLKEFMD